MVATTQLITTGNSQAVRLPKPFRVDTREAGITRDEHTGEITPQPKLDHDALQAFLHELRSLPVSDEFVPPREDAPPFGRAGRAREPGPVAADRGHLGADPRRAALRSGRHGR